MKTPDLKHKWSEWRERIKQEHPEFTDEDLHYEEGQEEDLVARLAARRKTNREEIYNWLHLMG